MTLSRDVLRDLIALVDSGEASADTRALVAAELAADPELARETEYARRTVLPPTPPPPPSEEKRALDKTRRMIKNRTSTFAVALFFTLLPFSFKVTDGELTFLLFRDAPKIAAAWWFTAAAMWISHFYIRRRLRVTGL
jgi:anti-sigma factor RsiW